MDSAFDNSNDATLDNLNQDIFQNSNLTALTDGDLNMDIKNTNITSPSLDPLNNIESYTIDNNQKNSDLIDQNRISTDDYIIDENNQHSPIHNSVPLNGKQSDFNVSDNDFGPESNVDDDTTGSPVTDEFTEKNDEIESCANIIRPDELVEAHGIHFESVDYLKTVDEADELCDNKKDVDAAADHEERNFDSVECENPNKMFVIDTPTDLLAEESTKLIETALPEKIEADPIEEPPVVQPGNAHVPESGEESEDEWNYIKVNRNANNEDETQERNSISHETTESQNICPDLLNDNQAQDDEIVRIEETSLSEEDMASQLNPDAKEFVPTTPSPTNTTPVNSIDPFGIAEGVTANMAALRLNLDVDDMVSQSPRKGAESPMIDVPVPEETDFLSDITQRPADLDSTVMPDKRPGSSSSQCSYQEMNLKEAMHGDEKQEYAPDALSTPDQAAFEMNSTNGDHEEFINILNKSMRNQDVMNASFYNDGTSDSNNPFKVDLNAVHRLPTSDDENEEERVEAPTGTTYSFEDTEFGMNEANDYSQVEQTKQNGSSEPEAEVNVGEVKANEGDSIAEAVQEMISENMAVLDECNLAPVEAENVSSPTTENVIDFTEQAENLISVEAGENFAPSAPTTVEEPIVASNLVPDVCLIPEQQSNIVAEGENIVEQSISNEITTEPELVPVTATQEVAKPKEVAPEVVAEPQIVAETESIVETAAVVGAVAAVAAGSAVAVAAATKEKPTTKSTKPAEPKSKVAPARKPLSTSVAAKPKTDVAAKTVAAPKTAPIPRPRTVPSQTAAKTAEKKPATTLAAKKPVNGEVKPAASVAATKRPVSSTTTVKSTISARTSTSTASTTTTKVTSSRLTAKPSTTTTGAEAPKRVSTTRTTTSTTSTTLKPRPTSSTVTRSPLSKATPSATDKSAKETVNKLQTTGAKAPISPRTTTATSRTGTLPLKKADAAKLPSAPAPAKRPITSTTRAAGTTTTASKVAPAQKRPMSTSTNRTTTLETAKKAASPLKKDTKSVSNAAAKETKPKENGNETEANGLNGTNGTNGTHAFDLPSEIINDAVNVEQEPVLI